MRKLGLISLSFICLLLSACGKKEINQNSKMADNIIETVEYTRDYSEMFTNLESQVENSSMIILAEITDISYQAQDNGMALTYETVVVKECLKGEVKSGDTILVVKDQGCISVKDYINSFKYDEDKEGIKQAYSNLTEDEMENRYIVIKGVNDELASVGDESLYFLEESNFYDDNGSYCRLTGSYGEYKRLPNGEFIETIDKVNEELSQDIEPRTFSNNAEDIEYEYDIPYDELKTKIEGYF
ncbi:hypothetical protein [Lactonifactor longoviformis]|uniref:hypothetical protein n=1 Tax=Lactonifactor longoviformis TaxID=341220 RepID=UPI001D020634|nr:hypothetical protein [Lactonifactor longoviformis]MCB5714591.1 hypothetical protein [Lactonifactor longoviformis]MCB5718545.1 hypothetical protein [Lactonifactor longoviformis]